MTKEYKQIQEFVREKCGGLEFEDIARKFKEEQMVGAFNRIMELRTAPCPYFINIHNEITLLTGFTWLEENVQLAIAKLLGYENN